MDFFNRFFELPAIEDKVVNFNEFVKDLVEVCDKHNARDLFLSYIEEFVEDMKRHGVICKGVNIIS